MAKKRKPQPKPSVRVQKIDAKANQVLKAGKGAKQATGKSRSYVGPG